MQHSKVLYEKGVLKNVTMLTQSRCSEFKFVARLDNIKCLYAGIKAINFAEHGYFDITEEGLRITVENGKSIQAGLFITASCFAEYYVDGVMNFSLNMSVLAECMGIHGGTNCSLKMYYKGASAPLVIVFVPANEPDVRTECSIKTAHYEEPIDYQIDENSASLNVAFIRGPDLAAIFNELDKSSEELQITLSPRSPHFKINILGVMQSEASVEVAKTSGMMELFNCRATTTARYRSAHMRMTYRALAAAVKVALKTDASGLLEMHFLFQKDEQAEIYAQFFLTPLADLD